MTKITDFDVTVTDDELRQSFKKFSNMYKTSDDLNVIFDIAITNKELFPTIRLRKSENTYAKYIEKWITGYVNAEKNPPSSCIAKPKSACNDPAVKKIVEIATKISEKEATEQEAHHNLFMSAENIQGTLLEEYIATEIRKFGWIWCKGNTLRAIDFYYKDKDNTIFLQIKNKNNTENSSSSAIRNGTNIEKWYRLATSKQNGACIPTYKWEKLNEIINSHNTTQDKCTLSEEGYIKFVSKVVDENNHIVTDR